jgi:uncharacterized protein
LRRLCDADFRRDLTTELRRLGFKFITLDLEGFRSGSHNLVLSLKQPGTAAI